MSVTFEIDVRVYYEDTDFSGMVYHANYLKFFERGRSEALREIGVHHSQLLDQEDPVAFTLSWMNIKYIKPARIDDLLRVQTRLAQVKGVRMLFEQEIWSHGHKYVSAEVEGVAINMAGKPRRLPTAIVDFYKAHKI